MQAMGPKDKTCLDVCLTFQENLYCCLGSPLKTAGGVEGIHFSTAPICSLLNYIPLLTDRKSEVGEGRRLYEERMVDFHPVIPVVEMLVTLH